MDEEAPDLRAAWEEQLLQMDFLEELQHQDADADADADADWETDSEEEETADSETQAQSAPTLPTVMLLDEDDEVVFAEVTNPVSPAQRSAFERLRRTLSGPLPEQLPLHASFLIKHLSHYSTFHAEESLPGNIWFVFSSPAGVHPGSIMCCVDPLVEVLTNPQTSRTWLEFALKLLYILVRCDYIFEAFYQRNVLDLVKSVLERHRTDPVLISPAFMALGNCAFHVSKYDRYEPFFQLACNILSDFLHEIPVVEASLWFLSNYFSVPRRSAHIGRVMELTCSALKLHNSPASLKMNCEAVFTLYNLLCEAPSAEFDPVACFVDQQVIGVLMRRMVSFATTEFILPTYDLLFCLHHDRRALHEIIQNLNCLLAVKVPTVRIHEHCFGQTSSYQPFRQESGIRFNAIALQLLTVFEARKYPRVCLGVPIPEQHKVVLWNSSVPVPSLTEVCGRAALALGLPLQGLPQGIRDLLGCFRKCTQCASFYYMHSACLIVFRGIYTMEYHWVCSARCVRQVVFRRTAER
eukprot:m.357900 g.357900  ORF g.357900 m.357900 type:complete len:523 (+) comp55978_c1_seq1:1943-3511(+)